MLWYFSDIRTKFKSMKLLLVEDEKTLSDSVVEYLKLEGHLCEAVYDYASAIDAVNINEYDCAIVDINLPDGSGLDIIRNIKQKSKTLGIIIVSARNSTEDKVEGLDIGADMYLTKPFHLAELNAHIKSISRRINFSGNNKIEFNEISILPDEHRVFVKQEEITLTKKEFELLLFFISNKNKVITKISLAELIWGDYMDAPSSLDFVYTHIKNLRKKLLGKGCEDYIKTVYGVGYKFTV